MPSHVSLGETVSEAWVLPFQTEKEVCPFFLKYHWYLSPVPCALTERVTEPPFLRTLPTGWVVIFSG